MSSLNRVRQLTADVLGVKLDRIKPESSSDTLEEWDSVQHLNLMLELESVFGVSLTPEDMASLHSVAELAAFVDQAAAKA